MARQDLIRKAQRPKMNARALFQGPQGSGKTWTMLSVARSLTKDTEGRILGIDTERESMLTYADVFDFLHLPWRPPYSPDELTATLDQLAATWVQSTDDVILIDSSSHFWQGSGGILDIAGGRVQGGWDKARPMQQALVEAMLALPCHLLLGARMKNSVLVSDGGKTIENVGLTIVQDETLGYELNIVVQMDMGHNIAVMKSRTPAVPVGRMYPGGNESKLAADYAEWLAGGIPPANREDVEAIVGVFAGIADARARKDLKDAFVEAFGMPHSLTADQVPDARQWLKDQGAAVGEGPAATGDNAPPSDDEVAPHEFAPTTPQGEPNPGGSTCWCGTTAEHPIHQPTEGADEPAPEDAPDGDEGAASDDPGADAPQPEEDTGDPEVDPSLRDPDEDADTEPTGDLTPEERRAAIIAEVQGLTPAAVKSRLTEAGLHTRGNTATLASRLAGLMLVEANLADEQITAAVDKARTSTPAPEAEG